ncbi:MAG: hypothetical protein ACE5IR_24585 [bacterium]
MIEKTIPRLSSKHDRKYLFRIFVTTQALADLAMVHGLEGLEKISRKLCSVLNYLLMSRIELSPAIKDKIRIAAITMRQVTGMEALIERHMTVERVARHVQIEQDKVQACTEKISNSLDSLCQKQLELAFEQEIESDPRFFFDIRESSVLKLVEEREVANSESDHPDLLTAKEVKL